MLCPMTAATLPCYLSYRNDENNDTTDCREISNAPRMPTTRPPLSSEGGRLGKSTEARTTRSRREGRGLRGRKRLYCGHF